MSKGRQARTAFFGPVGDDGGPAIKNKSTLLHLPNLDSVRIVNTYRHDLITRAKSVIRLFLCSEPQIIIAVSRKGRRVLWPIVAVKGKLKKRARYALICIGGTVAEEVAKSKSLAWAARSASLVAVETNGIADKLSALEVADNVYVFPNFAESVMSGPKARVGMNGALRCVFLSSVRNSKGIRTMIEATRRAQGRGASLELDIYGPIRSDFDRSIFDEIGENTSISYCGAVPKDSVPKVLSSYDCFIFPSECSLEGYPSVLAEAMAVGLPVIASDVGYNVELVDDGFSGYIFPAGNVDALAGLLAKAYFDRGKLRDMGLRNSSRSERFDSALVIRDLVGELQRRGWEL